MLSYTCFYDFVNFNRINKKSTDHMLALAFQFRHLTPLSIFGQAPHAFTEMNESFTTLTWRRLSGPFPSAHVVSATPSSTCQCDAPLLLLTEDLLTSR